ncbi:cyclic di-GMP phosphodiesterase Gmr [mine drainage metagenome]|uniref:Cyclic di-GMP phosphodiesterase Gmr n=1 Tax=mine drainage metagenome TaxID=410659 RepID=A0A1J5RSR6_9ZZZZ
MNQKNSPVNFWFKQVGVAALYMLSGMLIQHLITNHSVVSIIWPGSGIALAALLIGGQRYLWGILLGSFLLNIVSSYSLWISSGFILANTLEAYLGFRLLSRGTHAPFALSSLSSYLRLISFSAIANIVGALIGALNLQLAGVINSAGYLESALHWWMGDTLGVVLLVPFALVWWHTKTPQYTLKKQQEAMLLLASTFIVGQIVFHNWFNMYFSGIYTGYIMFAFVSWVAIRLDLRCLTLAVLIIAMQALSGAYPGISAFTQDISQTSLYNYWIYMLTLSGVGISLATYVNETKQNEMKLKESELHLRTIIASEPECIKIIDVEGNLVLMNPAGLALIEADSLEQVLGHNVVHIVAPQFQDDFIKMHQRVLAGESVQMQFKAQSLKGKPLWLETNAVPLQSNGQTMQLAITHDITDRKAAEDQLKIAATTFATSEAIMITDADANIIRVNQSFEKITGYNEAEVIGKNPRMLSSGQHDEGFYAAMWQEIDRQGSWSGEVWDKHKNGSTYQKQLTITAVKNANGETTQYVGLFANISERKQAEAAIRKTENHFVTILDSLDEIIWSASAPDFQLRHISVATERLYGVTQQAFMRDPELWFKFIHPDDKLRVKASTNQIFHLGKTELEYRIIRSDGQVRWLSDRMYVVYGENGEPTELVGTAYDITDYKQAEYALRLSEQQAKQSLEELKHQKFALDKHAIVAVTDVQGNITYANEKFCEISGYSLDELIGQDHAILNSGYHPKGFFKEMYRIVATGKAWHDEVCNRAKDGHLYWVDTTIAPFMGDDGKPNSYISIRTDITQRRIAEEQSSYLALYDPLTQLPNRRLLMDRLNQALASSIRNNNDGAVLFLDLDHFKTLNDTLGHDIGDLLLKQVAERLTACVRDGDTIARLGGDEFVVLLEDLSELEMEAAEQAEVIGEKILNALNLPYLLGTHEYQTTPSIGVVLFSNHGQSQESLLKHADIAMYQAKKSGRNRLSFFDPHMQDAINIRVDLEQELRKALDKQQFQLYYQIQVDNAGAPLGAEALIRWSHPQRGMISPFHFIPLAEETGLILPIGQWVLDTACAQIQLWQQTEPTKHLTLSVNVSAKQFRQEDFVSQVRASIEKYAIDPMLLKLELTESMLLEDIEGIITTMNDLKDIGIRFSLDDFGTGYSSLQYLKKLPLYQLKIDQSFVRDIATDSSDRALVLTIITMAHSLGLNVIAEGVETEEQRQFLLENDCKHYQGYLFSQPIPIDEFEILLSKHDAQKLS